MSLLDSFERLIGAKKPQQQRQAPQGQRPDITYNPNQNTNIPYSAHSPAMTQAGDRYTANPTSQEFMNVDPAVFGYPPDQTASRGMPNVGLQGYGAPQQNVNIPQGGNFNPGYTPLQDAEYLRRIQPQRYNW